MGVPLLIRIYYGVIVVIASVIALVSIAHLQYEVAQSQQLHEITLILNDLYPYEE